MSNLDFALEWAGRGIPVFRLSKVPGREKRPAREGWQDEATTELALIRKWAEAGHDFGLRTGVQLDGGHLAVVDIDMKDGVDGMTSLALLEMEHGEDIDSTPIDTPSGGLHYFVISVDPLSNSASSLAPGVDIRGAGGLVKIYAGPPRIIADAPGWVQRGAGISRQRSENADRELVELDTPANVAKAEAYLKGRDPAIEGEGGNTHTYVTIQHVRGLGISEELAAELIFESEWNLKRCQPAWDVDELEALIKNAYRYAKDPSGMNASGGLDDLKAQLAAEPIEDTSGTDPDEEVRPSRGALSLATPGELRGRPPLSWTIKNAIPQVGTGLLVGPFETLKTFVAIDLSARVSLGLPWLGRDCKRAGTVLYFPGEGQAGISKRLIAWEIHNGQEAGKLLVANRAPRLMDPAEAEAVLALAKEHDATMIVFDTVARAMVGGNENDQRDAGIFLDRMEDIARLANCFVLGVHHTGKEKGRGARGSTVLPAGVDVMFDVDKVGDLTITVKTGKMKDAEGWGIGHVLNAEVIEVGTDEDGDPVTSLALVEGGKAEIKEDAAEAEKRRQSIVEEIRTRQVCDVLGSIVEGAEPLAVRALVAEIEARDDGDEWDDSFRDAYVKWVRRQVNHGAFADWLDPKRLPGQHIAFIYRETPDGD